MKNVIFGILIVFFALLSCRGGEDDIQKIDQIFNLYIKNSAGKDLLNSKLDSTFVSVSMNDVFGTTDNAPVTFSMQKTTDTVNYIEYIAGAKRITLDSVSPENRTYHSKIALALRLSVNKVVTDTINDTLEIEYKYTPTVFEVSKVYYNNELKFTKQPNVPNVVTIIK
ncbi:hypothetical protein A0O34_10495 [Chryseobacterium glaciei]|uniref:Uncharacterized protein n=1 Tax=Chryseobacterium glaciei TaxID=1685010 RepID=A0A172XVM6_9FLAO|nr:hypothetical protein [Chryseobacterium glaciei]ANF50920.1 hypothetical protein A0O34_10495 [Chryseobacterium glaciei]